MIAVDGLKLSLKGSQKMLGDIVGALQSFLRAQLSSSVDSDIVDGMIIAMLI